MISDEWWNSLVSFLLGAASVSLLWCWQQWQQQLPDELDNVSWIDPWNATENLKVYWTNRIGELPIPKRTHWPWDNGTRAYALNLRCRPSWSTFGWGFTYFTGKLTRFSDVSLRARRPSSLSMTCDTALVEPYVVPNLPVGHTRVSLQAKHAATPHHTPRTARECSEQSPCTQARPRRGGTT